MTLYRCQYSKLLLPFPLTAWKVNRHVSNVWAFQSNISDMMIKIDNNSVVLWIEKSNRPMYTNRFVKLSTSIQGEQEEPYHICLYEDCIVAIRDSKWKKYFTKISN